MSNLEHARWLEPLRGRLGRRLLAGLLVLALVPLVASNALGYFRSSNIIEGLVERYLTGIAELQVLHVQDEIEHHQNTLRGIASLAGDRFATATRLQPNEEVDAFLDAQLAEHESFEALYVYSESGDLIASAPLPPVDLSLFMGPPLTRPRGSPDVFRDSLPPHSPWVRFAMPLGNGLKGDLDQRLFLGAYIQALGPSTFLRLPAHTAGAVETFIVDENGIPIFISHPHGVVDFGARLETPLTTEEVGQNQIYLDRNGVEVMGTSAPVAGFPWMLITEVPLSDALRELQRLRSVSLWLAAIFTGIVLVLAFVLANRIVRPIRRLVMANRRVAAGHFQERVAIQGHDEVAELGSAFNEMVGELERTSERIKEMHEREIERAGQLATVGELASGVAHEIKNPIAGIAGGLDIVMRYTDHHKKLSPIVREMRRQVKRVDLAVKDLLAFARPGEPERVPTDLNTVVDRVVTLVRPSAETAEVDVQMVPGDVPRIPIDGELIHQALVNLAMNAVQATAKGGYVRIATRVTDGFAELTIVDNGSGISPDQLDLIFKPFYTSKHQGTGLGLSITRSIVVRHGGSIAVESEPSAGTTFTILLPLQVVT